MVNDPLVLAENPKLVQELQQIETAKLRREQEIAAAHVAVHTLHSTKKLAHGSSKKW